MPNAIVLRDAGGPEVLRLEEIIVGEPAAGELRIRQTAAGVNFHDVYVRSGLYDTLKRPGIPGIEGAGVVEAVGQGVTGFTGGDRVAYVDGTYGGYASARLLPATRALKLPDGVPDDVAAASLVRGLTVQLLLHQVHRVQAGDTILVHAAAGGVGRLLCQWASALGATVIGTAGSAEKAELARRSRCAHAILYRSEDFVARVAEITGGKGVAVAYDSVGKDTFAGSLACLGMRGHLVNFGQASGPVPPFAVSSLAAKSNSVSRPILFHYIAEPSAYAAMAADLFARLADGTLTVEIAGRFPLADAAGAHRLLESRQAAGSIILEP